MKEDDTLLAKHKNRGAVNKQIAVRTHSEAFSCFLSELLSSWGFEICSPDSAEVLLLSEEGLGEPLTGQKVIWLTASQYQGSDRLSLPLEFEQLWQTLEHRFHRPPRMHIRMSLELPAVVSARGRVCTTALSSLSDMGGRFFCPHEMIRDEQVMVQMEVSGVRKRMDGCVIFAAPCHEEGVEGFRIGVVFHGLKRDSRDDLRNFLIQRYLEAIRGRMSDAVFRAGLAEFALSPSLRQSLNL
jgi:hypothetical protein